MYDTRTFALPELTGLSAKQIEVHLGLYAGYVKHTNLILEKITALHTADAAGNAYLINELRRRLSFEFDGMRMHEYYFSQLEHGATDPTATAPLLTEAVTKKYGSWDAFAAHLREVASTRGIGWVVVYHDTHTHELHTTFVNDHELGQLAGLPLILAIDLWEHAFMVDYVPSEKSIYLDALLANINWTVVEKRMLATAS